MKITCHTNSIQRMLTSVCLLVPQIAKNCLCCMSVSSLCKEHIQMVFCLKEDNFRQIMVGHGGNSVNPCVRIPSIDTGSWVGNEYFTVV